MNSNKLSEVIQAGDSGFSMLQRRVEMMIDSLKYKQVISKEEFTRFNSSVDTLVTWVNLVLLPSIKAQAGGGDNITYYTITEVYIGYNFHSMLTQHWSKDSDKYNMKPALIKYRAFLLRLKPNALKYYNARHIKQIKKQLA